MSSKTSRTLQGPSWTEVILGALLSVVLGAALGAVLLMLRPVTTAKEVPKDAVKGAVYYLEGSRDTAKGSAAAQKRAAFAGGQSVSVVEDELNALVAAPSAAKGAEKGKSPEKGKEAAKAAPASEGMFAVGKPNFRIRDGVLQVAVPVTVNAMDLGLKLIAQARGSFVKKGDQFVYEPIEILVGSCPLQRVPMLGAWARASILAAESVPEDIQAAWKKATQVAIEGNTLKVTMP